VFALLWYVVIVFFFVQGFIEQEQRINKEFAPQPKSLVYLPEGAVLISELNLQDDAEFEAGLDARFGAVKSPQVTSAPNLMSLDHDEFMAAFDELLARAKPNAADRKKSIAELEARREEIYAEKRFTKRKSLSLLFLPFVFVPWIILFSMRLLRYVIEGFSSKDVI